MTKKIILLTDNKKEKMLFKGRTIMDLFRVKKINPQTVLVKKNSKLATEDEIIKKGDIVELISIVSKG